MNKTVRTFRAAAAALGFVATSIVSGPVTAGVVDPTALVAGTTQLALSEQWWQWALGLPGPSNPITDPTGERANFNNDGPVFFLAGNTGGTLTRSFNVPIGKPIFFPVVNGFDLEIKGDPNCNLSCAFGFLASLGIDGATGLHATLDGVDLLTFPSYRQTSTAFFTVHWPNPEPFAFGLPPGDYDVVSDGYWVALDGLTEGPHTLVFGGATSAGFSLEVTDNISAVPEPETFGLVLLGVLAAFGSRHRARNVETAATGSGTN